MAKEIKRTNILTADQAKQMFEFCCSDMKAEIFQRDQIIIRLQAVHETY